MEFLSALVYVQRLAGQVKSPALFFELSTWLIASTSGHLLRKAVAKASSMRVAALGSSVIVEELLLLLSIDSVS